MKKIILYGAGENFSGYREYLSKRYAITGASDSSIEKSALCDDFIAPDDIKKYESDYVVVTVSRYYEEIKSDLVQNRGIPEQKIVDIRQVMSVENDLMVVRMCGGMGNLLFQYAFAQKLQHLYPEIPLKMDLSWYYSENMFLMSFQVPWIFERLFHQKLRIASKEEVLIAKTRNYYAEKETSQFDAEALAQGSGYYSGYWQTGRYFDDIDDIVRNPLRHINEYAVSYRQKKLLEQIRNSESVALWVRRGDYIASEENRKMFGDICTEDYYQRAIEYIRSKYADPEFFVFSNDEDYIKEKYKDMNVIIYESDSQEIKEFNIFLISQCKHIIGANSSMSWWASWIHGKDGTVIVPERWNNEYQCPDVYEDNWVKF